MTFAIIQTGGKQYRVKAGDTLKVEKLIAPENGKIAFNEVLLVGDEKEVKIGTPALAGASVTASVVRDGKAQKVNIVKYKAKVRHKKILGHRQPFTEIKIEEIKTA